MILPRREPANIRKFLWKICREIMEKFLSHRLNPICFNIPPPVLRIFFFLEEKYDEEDSVGASFQRDIELERILWKIFEEGKKRERENYCSIFAKFFLANFSVLSSVEEISVTRKKERKWRALSLRKVFVELTGRTMQLSTKRRRDGK